MADNNTVHQKKNALNANPNQKHTQQNKTPRNDIVACTIHPSSSRITGYLCATSFFRNHTVYNTCNPINDTCKGLINNQVSISRQRRALVDQAALGPADQAAQDPLRLRRLTIKGSPAGNRRAGITPMDNQPSTTLHAVSIPRWAVSSSG